MIKIKKLKLSVVLPGFIILLISVFLFSSCRSHATNNDITPISTEISDINVPDDSKVQSKAADITSYVDQAGPGEGSKIKGDSKKQSMAKYAAKIAIAKDSTAQMETAASKTSDVKGIITNQHDGQKTAYTAAKQTATAAKTGTDIQSRGEGAVKPVENEKYKEYKVVLGADAKIKIPGVPGKLRVWIGIPEYKPDFSAQMTQATGTLPAVGATARVTPVAPAFKVEPQESICMKIHPTGSEVGFTLTPLEEGTFDVGADVKLYDSVDCSGTPIPKATSYLHVQVVVDHSKEIKKQTRKFQEVFWEKLLNFWGQLLVIFFALLLFLLRRHLKRWFGFEDKK